MDQCIPDHVSLALASIKGASVYVEQKGSLTLYLVEDHSILLYTITILKSINHELKIK
jgi:hypothetical protein